MIRRGRWPSLATMAERKLGRGGRLTANPSTRSSESFESSPPLASPVPNRQVDASKTEFYTPLSSTVHHREDRQGGERDDVRHRVRDPEPAVGGHSHQHREDTGSRPVSHPAQPWSVGGHVGPVVVPFGSVWYVVVVVGEQSKIGSYALHCSFSLRDYVLCRDNSLFSGLL